MKKTTGNNWADLLFLIGTACFFFSCIATSYQVAKTLEPGEVEVSPGYMQGRSIEEFSEPPIQLIGLNGRVGVSDNFDIGLEHTFDVSKENEGAYNSIWGDTKFQLTNKDNELKKLTFSTGLLKGYVYDEDAQIHFTSVPVYLSSSSSNRFTSTFMYRFGLLGEGFIPDSDSFDDPRHTFTLGLEYYLNEPDPTKWNSKFALSIGTIEDDIFLFNFGFKFSSPYK